jgi:hypothetical protein
MCSPVDASTAKPPPFAACPDPLLNLPVGTGAAPTQSPHRASASRQASPASLPSGTRR